LKTQIGVKKMHLHQLASLLDTVEPGHALLEKSIRITQMALLCSSSKLVDESLTNKSGVAMKVDKSKVPLFPVSVCFLCTTSYFPSKPSVQCVFLMH
jgi:hypothetical protein